MEPLTSESEPQKRPIILYIIIGVLLIVIIVLSIILGITLGREEKKEETFNPIKEDHFIKIKESFYDDDPEYGANSYHGCGNNFTESLCIISLIYKILYKIK